ncbi:transporter substrate-binding domain-containing protein [Spirulina sp. CS-785/01]|uniref:transporter substrate-binding domain-containing protein n=1 Tax=Spirulina sp. CS-785/01 TaxID=3021716 RepID=UPI00232CA3C1|nr:transporter substrate-binding domain-containing protein [Spirulina sp. CS-785/01]MDB9314805.1 transporter substrate-binding domain-containing protein [Spirulina sp. CS-785/01]
MKRRNFVLTLAVAVSLGLGAIAGCGSNETTGSEDGEKVLVMATSADYPPYEFYETARGEGEPVGFDIDIAQYITEELGYELEINDMDFNGIIPALQSNRADFAMAGMTPTEEREESVDFSEVYYEATNTIIANKGSGYDTFADLAGKTVGVQLGSTQQETAQEKAEEIGDITLEPRNKVSEIVQEIKAGRIDAAIVEDTVAKGYIQNNPDLEFLPIKDQEAAGSAIAFPKDSELVEEFNAVLAEMKENGEMEKLITKWFEEYYANQGAEEGAE